MKSFNEINIKFQAYFETLGLMRLSQSLLSKVNADGLKRGNIPFGLPKDTYSVGETGYIITYGIIRTSFISKDVYVNTSGTVTDSSTNQFSYLGVSNAYGDVLWDGFKVNKNPKDIGKTGSMSNIHYPGSPGNWTTNYICPCDGIIKYIIQRGGDNTAQLKVNGVTIWNNEGGTGWMRVFKGDNLEAYTKQLYNTGESIARVEVYFYGV